MALTATIAVAETRRLGLQQVDQHSRGMNEVPAFVSSDPTICDVVLVSNTEATLLGVGAGVATITATIGAKSDTVVVTVYTPAITVVSLSWNVRTAGIR